MAERKILRASEPFFVDVAGAPVPVNPGDLFWSDDEIVKGREKLFGEVTVRESRPRPNPPVGPGGETADQSRPRTVGLKDVDTPGDSKGHAGEVVGEKPAPVSTPKAPARAAGKTSPKGD